MSKKQISITIIVENSDEKSSIDDIIATLDTISDEIGWENIEINNKHIGNENSVFYNFKIETID